MRPGFPFPFSFGLGFPAPLGPSVEVVGVAGLIEEGLVDDDEAAALLAASGEAIVGVVEDVEFEASVLVDDDEATGLTAAPGEEGVGGRGSPVREAEAMNVAESEPEGAVAAAGATAAESESSGPA